ncbi:MAG: hypothetical protein H7Y17_11045 [Chlorobia bacterium]|nr:hypothetical protein [Fimbriimonadaceae bacterium]
MRTTIDLPADAYHIAKAFAKERKMSLGKAIAELIIRPTPNDEPIRTVNGWPVLHAGRVLTPEIVRELIDED